ncbi:MAG: hypothetical protein O3C17_00580 [Planctomycetota bacterium]|nr:hypothetical protein [Planctomycetota bacterium]
MASESKTRTAIDRDGPATDPPLSRLVRVKRWLGENIWLVIGSGVVLMMAPSAARDAESTEMRANREKIEGMTQTERDLLLSNFDSWRKLPQSDRRSVRAMHEVVAKDEQLSKTLAAYHTWLASVSSVSYEFRERILNEKDVEKRLRMIKGHLGWAPDQPRIGPDEPPYEPIGQDAFFIGLQRGPSLLDRDFEDVIEVIAKWCGAPNAPPGHTPVELLKYHLDVLELAGTKLRDMRSVDGPVCVPEKVVTDILNAIGNDERKDEIAILVGDNPAALLMLLLRSIRGEDIRRIAMTNGPMLDEYYEQLPAPRRQYLDRLQEKERSMRIAWMWVEEKMPGAMDMMKRFMRFNREPGDGRFQPGVRRPFIPNGNRDRPGTE